MDKHALKTAEGEFVSLTANLRNYLPETSISLVRKAYEKANEWHGDQKRQSGEPYITHPLAVANILTELKVDLSSIIAAILHDVVEDTHATIDDVKKEFGEEVAGLVDGLTKIAKIKFQSSQERLAENFRKMIVAMAKDIRVILIKLADRLHNMRTLEHVPEEKRVRIAQETQDIYAPLTNRLGIYQFKSELEDLCLRYLKPTVYQELRSKIATKKSERQSHIHEIKSMIESELSRYGFENFKVYGRPKHFYSIYKKMIERKMNFEDMHDLFAFRIIVDSIKDCYEALGIVHAMWKPMPGRFKDYIAMPKANMYQSLHTTIIRPSGEPIEIQIRTKEMQKICEFGIAAHWVYKEKGSSMNGIDPKAMEKFSWLRQMMHWQNEIEDPDEFLEAVKVDLFQDEIFVFTPKGDVIELPLHATTLDFAFAVHTAVGLKTAGAKVNGRMVPIKKMLKSGDIIEILTSPNQRPSKDWLSIAITTKARNKIRSFLRQEQRDQSKKIGFDLLSQKLDEADVSIEKLTKSEEISQLVKVAKEKSIEDVLIAVGYGKIDAKELVDRYIAITKQASKSNLKLSESEIEKFNKEVSKKVNNSQGGISVSGIENMLVHFAKCCHPLPGEQVVGFITRGRGVTIHKSDCPKAMDSDPIRKVDVYWQTEDSQAVHNVGIKVVCQDKPGVLAEVTSSISATGVNIKSANIRIAKDMLGVLEFELSVRSISQLQSALQKIEILKNVLSVERKNISKTLEEKKVRKKKTVKKGGKK